MSVKIKVSYEQEQELEAVKALLAPMLRNVKVSKRNEYLSYTRVNLRFSQVFGIFDNLPGKANFRYFLSERSLSKRGLKLLQRCNKKNATLHPQNTWKY